MTTINTLSYYDTKLVKAAKNYRKVSWFLNEGSFEEGAYFDLSKTRQIFKAELQLFFQVTSSKIL